MSRLLTCSLVMRWILAGPAFGRHGLFGIVVRQRIEAGGRACRAGAPTSSRCPDLHSRVAPRRGARSFAGMTLVVVLLVLWLVLAIVGFAIKGLLWLALIGLVLFVGTGIVGWIRRRAS